MHVVALDLSLTATGVASIDGAKHWSGCLEPKTRRGFERIDWIRAEVLKISGPWPDLVVIEGYAFGSPRQSHSRAIAELGGVIRMTLHDLGIPFVDVPPASLKKYATGKGNAPKEQVLAASWQRLGYSGHDHNQADALWLLEMALDHYGHAEPRVPKAHREALAKIDWPVLETAEESAP